MSLSSLLLSFASTYRRQPKFPLDPQETDPRKPNLYLIGFMGTGKTSAGELAADKLGLRFLDSDREIEKATGLDVAAIFEREGEDAFREKERAFILQGHPGCGCLVSCGGGLPVPEGMLVHLKERGLVFALWAEPQTIYERTRDNPRRPLLQVSDPLSEITDLLKKRESVYLQADKVISTEMRSTKAVADLITRSYEENPSSA